MSRTPRLLGWILLTWTAGGAFAVSAQERDRARIPDRFKWDLTKIYPSDEAWREAKEKLAAALPRLREFKGQLASSPAKLADALELSSSLSKELARAYVYASMKSDEDTRVSTYQGMQQEMVQLAADLGAETSYMEPEILKIDPAVIERFVAQEPRLTHLPRLPRRHPAPPRPHRHRRRGDACWRAPSVLASGPSTIYGILSDADFPYPTVTLSDGKTREAR